MIRADHFPSVVQATIDKIDLSRFAIPIKLTCHARSDHDVVIHLAMSVNDIARGFPTTINYEATIGSVYGSTMTLALLAEYVVTMIEAAVKNLVYHEVEECLFYDGKQFRDPHAAEKDDEAKRAEMRRMSGAR